MTAGDIDLRPDDVVYRGCVLGDTPWDWLHLEASDEVERSLLADEDLPKDAVWALLEQDTQPRARMLDGTLLLMLRGINQLSGADPEDMISLRLAITGTRIVSLERRRLGQIDRMMTAFEAGNPPKSTGHFVLRLIEELREAVEPVLDRLETLLVRLERHSIDHEGDLGTSERSMLPHLRQDIILIHRFVAPQAAAIHQLVRLDPPWLVDRATLEEEADSYHRIAADLDALRQRAQVVAEQVHMAQAERTNRNVLVLSLVSAIFLPLSFLTGLLGVNLAGIPGAQESWGFLAFCGILLFVGGVAYALARSLVR